MPREVSPLYRIYETGNSGAVVYLNADAETFWSVILRHALFDLGPFYGTSDAGSYGYRALDLGYREPRTPRPALNETGTYVWLDGPEVGLSSGYRSGGRLCWEPIGAGRLRVVYEPASDLPPNLDMAWEVLDAIHKVYPEARDQLPDIEGLIDSWAYDEATRDWWRDQVAMRLEREQGRVATAEITLGSINLTASAHGRGVTPDTVELSVEGLTTGSPVIDTVAIGAPRPERPPVYSNTDLRTTLAHYLVTQCGVSSLEAACGLVAVARGTYTSHRDSNPPKFVSPEEYLRRVGRTLRQDADEHLARR